jgi:hypothetical protein
MPTASKIVLIRQLVEAARNNLDTATQLLKDLGAHDVAAKASTKVSSGSVQRTEEGAVIIEGVFDGQNMVGPDGKLYSVPANYASKSKLVEGDLLKLTISPDGSFIYKQIGPVERDRIVGVLVRDEQTDEYRVLARGSFYRILLASVTYFKAAVGDEVVILVPKGTPSSWAAVENVIKKESENSLVSTQTQAVVAEPAIAQNTALPSAKPAGRSKKTAIVQQAEPVAKEDVLSAEPEKLEI